MKRKKNLLVIVLLVLSFAAHAFYSNYGRVIGTYLGYSETSGYSFSISDELSTRIISFGHVEDSTLVKRFKLKTSEDVIGKQFVITYSSGTQEETNGVDLTLISLKRANTKFAFKK